MAPVRNFLTLRQKIEVVNIAEQESLNVRKLGERFNISKSQAAEIVKNKEIIRRQWQSGENLDQKSAKLKGEAAQIDRVCFEWFARARNQKIPISGPLIKTKAKEVAIELGLRNFSASDGWLNKCRRRHNISFKCISGESADVNQEDVNLFLERLPGMLLGYRPEDIYNADALICVLFFRALPDKTLMFKGEKCTGGKMLKERLTILFCANMAGDKEKLQSIKEWVVENEKFYFFLIMPVHTQENLTLKILKYFFYLPTQLLYVSPWTKV
ncbi:tigger transposable element-derived protein 6-like [Anthonomus grandis grandis]|uniref:tigger transposable element-derived protein 6-like n=1 Tax=Anthonomus grandis grandis TaxID=2921223 RepID=UPI0021661DA1|nr:tigger transposable element-derived protein 6-like [Anthonomus grandis grandis]